jgi:hypothetical protein
MGLSVKIDGIKRVKNTSKKFEGEIIKAVHRAMIKGALVDVETGAKKKITQDRHVDTGRLRASIHTTYKDKEIYNYNDMEGGAYEDRLDVKRKDYNVFVGSAVIYAKKIEFLDSFLYFAFKNGQKKLPRRIKQEVQRVLKGMR